MSLSLMSFPMRARSPSSRAALKMRLSLFDTFWAFVAPFLALLVRDAYILSYDGALTAALYCLVAAGFSIIAFLAFRLRDQMARYFSVNDAIDIVKAVLLAEFMIFIVLFTFTRLQGVPRSTPLIHALILMAGLVGARTLVRLFHAETTVINGPERNASEHIIMLGATRLSSLYIKMLESYFSNQHQVIGVLDSRPEMRGRAIAGVRVIGSPNDLQPIIDEFAIHGIHTTRLIVGGDTDVVSDAALDKIRRVCQEREVRLDFVPQLIGLDDLSKRLPERERESVKQDFGLPPYFQFKRIFDFVMALALIIFFVPLLIVIALLILIDVGIPVLFWQQRLGQNGQTFLIYKFRTLRPPFDGRGHPVPEPQRLSWIGSLLRQSRLDELPQLLNVLVGDMSMVGPRPLLPEDQPARSAERLMVRPGITGWAQVNGGNFLTPREKGTLDEWYIRYASTWLDLRIIVMTIRNVLRGNKSRSAQALAAAKKLRSGGVDEILGDTAANTLSPRQYLPSNNNRGAQVARGK